MLAVYDGQQCVGFILARGHQGYEAFDADSVSFGIFSSEHDAANAISAAAGAEKVQL
jgi:hypothetical protein